MEHLSFLQLVAPRFSHPNPVSPFYWGFSLAPFSQGCPSPGLLLPCDQGQDLTQVLTTWSSSPTVLPLGAAPRPSPSSGHHGSSPAGGMRSIQPGRTRRTKVGVCPVV